MSYDYNSTEDYEDYPEEISMEEYHQNLSFENYPCCNGCGEVYNDPAGRVIDATKHTLHTCTETNIGKSQPSFAKEIHMFNSVKVISRPTRGINADSLNIGEYARVVDGTFVGNIVLKTRLGVVNISDHTSTWDSPFSTPQVERLSTGDKLEITVGFTAQVEQEIRNLKASNKIMAIKKVRELTNWGLMEAKLFVEAL